MPVKVTMQMQMQTLANATSPLTRVAEWTESHWLPVEDLPTAKGLVRNGILNPAGGLMNPLPRARALLLPDEASFIGFRLQKYEVGPAGELPVGTYDDVAMLLRNDKGETCDTPQHCCLCSAGLITQPRRIRFAFRALPNNRTDGGALAFGVDYRAAVRQYLQVLAAGYGTIVDQRVGANFAGQSVNNISALGIIALNNAPVGIVVGGMVKITQTTRTATGRRTSGVFQVKAVDPVTFIVELHGWDKGATTGGTMRRFERVYAAYNPLDIDYQRATSRKVGSRRSYRGRNPART